jgi:hypothetical protein
MPLIRNQIGAVQKADKHSNPCGSEQARPHRFSV